MKILVLSDIHGCYKTMMKMLEGVDLKETRVIWPSLDIKQVKNQERI